MSDTLLDAEFETNSKPQKIIKEVRPNAEKSIEVKTREFQFVLPLHMLNILVE